MKINTATGAPAQLDDAIEAWMDNSNGVRVHYNGGSFMGEIVLTGNVFVIDGWVTGERPGTGQEIWINLAQVTWIDAP